MTTLEKAAHDIGAKGSEPTEAERLAFESWMRGHCWKVEGSWDGKQYVHAHESTGFVHGGAMNTRRLWAAWRDRGAVARVLAGQAQAVEPVGVVTFLPGGVRPILSRLPGARLNSGDKLYTRPAPPPAGEVPAGIKELLSAKPITGPCGQCKSSADPCYCGNVNTGECAELVELPVAFGEIQYQRPSGQWGRIEGYTRNQMREAVAAAVAKAEAKHAQQVAVPDMFWNHDDADKLYSSISEFLNDEMCNGTPLEVGDIRTVQRAVRLPNIDIRITSVNDDECDADYEIVEAQGAKP